MARKWHENGTKHTTKYKKKAVDYLWIHKRITNKEYVQLNPDITDRTALNDLNDMLEKRIIKAGSEKKFRFYALA